MNNTLPNITDASINYTSVLTHRDLLASTSNDTEKINEVQEWIYFLNFVNEHLDKKPYRTEWMIYDEDIKISGSIDMVYENEDGTLSIYDWKRCKQITKVNTYNKFAITKEISDMPDSNFWHYSLQLNTYKAILETKYDKTIRDMFLVQLHPEAEEGNYVLYQVPDLSITVHMLLSKLRQDPSQNVI
jgi:ATP-dependent exoDNAse (exonuclease V) beta subunit